MIKYYCERDFVLNSDDNEIVFYVYNNESITKTIVWKYDLNNNTLHECAEINEKVKLWKYSYSTNNKMQYIGINSSNRGTIIGLDCTGKKLFEYEIGGMANKPIFDDEGNIYVIVNQVQVRCITKEGKEIWRWSPRIDISKEFFGERSIVGYWIFQKLLYVVANGQIFQISLEGKDINFYNIENCNIAFNIEMQGENLLFSSSDRRSIICCNMCGKRRWGYEIKRNEIIKKIYSNFCYIYIVAKKIMDNTERIYVLDDSGKMTNIINLKRNSCAYLFEEKMTVLNRGDFDLYNKMGEKIFHYSIKDSIIWARNIKDNVYMIIKRNGSLAVMVLDNENLQKGEIVELSRQDDTEVSSWNEDLELWVNIVVEYLMRNMQLCMKYIGEVTIKEFIIKYKYNDVYNVQAILEDNSRVSLLAESISNEKLLEEDVNEYKEVKYINIIWIELCNSVTEKNVNKVFERVCKLLTDDLKYQVKCEEI